MQVENLSFLSLSLSSTSTWNALEGLKFNVNFKHARAEK